MLVKKVAVVVVVVMFVVSTFTWPSHLVVSKVLPSLAMLSDSPGEGQQAGRGGGRENTQTDRASRNQKLECKGGSVCVWVLCMVCVGRGEGAGWGRTTVSL